MARAAGDVGIAAVALAAILLLELAWTNAVGRYATSVCLPLPGTVGERVAWTWVALSVGVCEEIVYRGYFLGQLTARSGRPVFGLLAQAALFGVAHLDRGPAGAILAGLDGLLLGVVARARGSLLPGMMCHGAVDAMSGWLAGAG
jgi:membrane protease YdiL (CAAX protease family)